MDTYVRSLVRDAELMTSTQGVAELRHAKVSVAQEKLSLVVGDVAPAPSVGD